jgi:hypothetical protein
MKVIITGSTGMVGRGVLLECLDDADVTEIVVINRSPLPVKHPKLKEIICKDWFDLSQIKTNFNACDAVFFCLGLSAANLNEETYRKYTHDLTLKFANAVLESSPKSTFCYVSGQGTADKKPSKVMWARVKGDTEKNLLKLPFKGAYMFRPGYIHPMRGVKSKTALYRLLYVFLSPLYPIFRRLSPKSVTTSVNVGKAMLSVAKKGYDRPALENSDINQLGKAYR